VHLDAFRAQLFSERPDCVQAEDDRIDLIPEASNRFGDEHLGARDVHHVQHESDLQRGHGSFWHHFTAAPKPRRRVRSANAA
jgi:hypothetical protein